MENLNFVFWVDNKNAGRLIKVGLMINILLFLCLVISLVVIHYVSSALNRKINLLSHEPTIKKEAEYHKMKKEETTLISTFEKINQHYLFNKQLLSLLNAVTTQCGGMMKINYKNKSLLVYEKSTNQDNINCIKNYIKNSRGERVKIKKSGVEFELDGVFNG